MSANVQEYNKVVSCDGKYVTHIELEHWSKGIGIIHIEPFDSVDGAITAQEWIKGYDGDPETLLKHYGDAVRVSAYVYLEIADDSDELIQKTEDWITRESK